jgi:hypothetical protein
MISSTSSLPRAALLIVCAAAWPGRAPLRGAVLLALLAGAVACSRSPSCWRWAAVIALKVVLIPRSHLHGGRRTVFIAPGRWPVSDRRRLLGHRGVASAPATAADLPTEGGIPLTFAMALIGLFVCVTGRDALGQVLGFLMLENGIFGLALLATYGLPSIVEAGVFLDVLVIVLLMEGVVLELRREHDSLDVDRLRDLRE